MKRLLLIPLVLSCQEAERPPEALPELAPAQYQGEAEVRLRVRNFDEAVRKAKGFAGALGGYIVSAEVWEGEPKSAELVLAVPSGRLYDLIDSLKSIKGARLLSLTVRQERTEEELARLEAKLEGKRALLKRLEKLLERAQTVSEAVEVERELAKVSEELAELEARVEELGRRAKFAEVWVSIEEAKTKRRFSFFAVSLVAFSLSLLLAAAAALVVLLKGFRAPKG